MNRQKQAIFSFLIMLMVILDSKIAINGAVNGINICIRTVIPALFPLITLSIYLTNALQGSKLRIMDPLTNICGISGNAKPLLLVGLIYAGKNDLVHQATMLRSAPYSLDGIFCCLHL